MALLQKHKANIIIDGQFGSTGKGSFAGYVAMNDTIDIGVCNTAPNAGHTAIINDQKIITKHLPISSVIQKNDIYLNAGARINPDILRDECAHYSIDTKTVLIHPRATVIGANDIQEENQPISVATKISSTQTGVGSATSRKIKREKSAVAENSDILNQYFTVKKRDLNQDMDDGKTLFLETGQGYGLGINEGFSYPYCTSHSITVTQTLADANIHPSYLGNVILTLRTYPIRVGNILDESGKEIGYSGDFYPDSQEISFADLGLPQEYTTNTNRPRRIATFSLEHYKKVTKDTRPDIIFLNFANYCSDEYLLQLIDDMFLIYKPVQFYVGYGPTNDDIRSYF